MNVAALILVMETWFHSLQGLCCLATFLGVCKYPLEFSSFFPLFALLQPCVILVTSIIFVWRFQKAIANQIAGCCFCRDDNLLKFFQIYFDGYKILVDATLKV